jgi:hypothetical protein
VVGKSEVPLKGEQESGKCFPTHIPFLGPYFWQVKKLFCFVFGGWIILNFAFFVVGFNAGFKIGKRKHNT